jgi:magnesium transporter
LSMVSRLFDAAGDDREIELDEAAIKRLSDRQLLWVDVSGDEEGQLRRVGELFALEPESIRNLENPIGQPRLDVLERYFEVNVVAIGEDERPVPMDLLAGPNWVISVHHQKADFLDPFRQQLSADRELGRIEAPSFLAALLDWQLGTYFKLVDELERGVDVLDERALRGGDREDRTDLLAEMVQLRHRTGRIRRTIAPQREVFAALARPGFEVLATSESAAHFRALQARVERAIDAIENAREMLIGSFDLYMTQTAQRTNDVMRVLTIVNVILLPAVVLAGIMGMNFKVAFFENTNLFWIVIAAMVVIAAGSLLVARWRQWL